MADEVEGKRGGEIEDINGRLFQGSDFDGRMAVDDRGAQRIEGGVYQANEIEGGARLIEDRGGAPGRAAGEVEEVRGCGGLLRGGARFEGSNGALGRAAAKADGEQVLRYGRDGVDVDENLGGGAGLFQGERSDGRQAVARVDRRDGGEFEDLRGRGRADGNFGGGAPFEGCDGAQGRAVGEFEDVRGRGRVDENMGGGAGLFQGGGAPGGAFGGAGLIRDGRSGHDSGRQGTGLSGAGLWPADYECGRELRRPVSWQAAALKLDKYDPDVARVVFVLNGLGFNSAVRMIADYGEQRIVRVLRACASGTVKANPGAWVLAVLKRGTPVDEY